MGVLDGLETTLKNCRLYYRWQYKKEADAPVVLLLHGWGCDSSIFSFIENGLSEDASVLSVDFPGHGKSGAHQTVQPQGRHRIPHLLPFNDGTLYIRQRNGCKVQTGTSGGDKVFQQIGQNLPNSQKVTLSR